MCTLMTVVPTIVWCGCSVATDLTAEQILEKSAASYAVLKSYEGTTTVNTKIDTGSLKLEQSATAKITFVRPKKIRIEGKTAGSKSFGRGGSPYAIVSDGKDTWLSWALTDNGAYRKTNLTSAISSMTGVASRAPTVIPSALMKLEWQYPFDAGVKSAGEFAGREKVGDNECYKIVIRSPTVNFTYWIDAKSFLLRQLKEERDGEQLAAVRKQVEERASGRFKLRVPEVKLTSMESVHTFAIDRVNATLAEDNFADPTEK